MGSWRGAFQCTARLVWNKLAASKTEDGKTIRECHGLLGRVICGSTWTPFLSTVKKKKTLMYRASSIKFYYKSTSILSRVLFSDWPRYPLVYFVLVEFYWYTNADAVIWLAEPLHTISHSSPLFSDSDSHVTRLCSSAETISPLCPSAEMPGWIAVFRENVSVLKQAGLSAFFFKFYLWLSRLSSPKVEK